MSDDQLSIHTLLHPVIANARRAILPSIEANSIELMRNLSEDDLGISFMSRVGLERCLENKTLVHVPLEDNGPVLTELGLYMRSSAGVPAAVDAFVQLAVAEIHRRTVEEQGLLAVR